MQAACETITHLHLAVRLRMSEAITPLPLYTFKTRTGTNLCLFSKPLSSYAIFMVAVSFVNVYRTYPYLAV